MLAVQWELEGRRDLYLLLARECPATCLVKVLATWSWRGRKRDRGLKVRGVGGEEGGEESLRETEVGGGRRTGELLMIGTGGIEETLGEGGKAVVGGIITGEKGNGRKMRGGGKEEEEEEEGGRKEEEVKMVQEEAGRGAESEEGAMTTGALILLLEVTFLPCFKMIVISSHLPLRF